MKLKEIAIRTYQVGFGDCFLLSFDYDAFKRHALIDFGSTHMPDGLDMGDQLLAVAKDVEDATGGELHVVVATHRHKDHISGFAGKPGAVIKGLKPKLVILPWTEQPDLEADAQAPTALHLAVRSLRDMHSFAEAALASVAKKKANRGGRADDVEEEIAFIADDNLKNREAVENLATMGEKTVYVHHGYDLAKEMKALLPGVSVSVLGPPTLEQSEAILKQRSKDSAEFWHLRATEARGYLEGAYGELFPGAERGEPPPEVDWFRRRLDRVETTETLELVRILDDAMNNTSVILMFTAGKQGLLFPGDAQIENWSYALTGPESEANLDLLSAVTLYKVGHHGSLNATPKTLWSHLKDAQQADGTRRMIALLSTLSGVHGSKDRKTEVPRTSLLKELRAHTELISTERSDQLFKETRLVIH